jgi:uncharacterized membrane protein YeaQ/YmgE (transglycosylase-associated protein family)
MNIIIWLIVGGIVGWLASLIMRTDAQQGIILNVIVGIVGAFLGGWLGRACSASAAQTSTTAQRHGFIISLIGAVVPARDRQSVPARGRVR